MPGLSSKYSRRGFLKGLAAAGIGLAASSTGLAACAQPQAAPAEPKVVEKVVEKEVTRVVEGTPQVVKETVKETQVVEKVVTVQAAATGPTKVIVASYQFMFNEVQYATMAAKYNAEQDKAVIVPEMLPPGPWWQKLAAEVKDDKVRYNAILYNNSYRNTPHFAGMGIIQPIEDYLNASTQPEAATRLDLMFNSVKQAATYKGKIYGLPVGIQYSSWSMRRDLAEGAEVTNDLSKSFEDVTEAATKIRAKYKSQGIDSLALQMEDSNGTVSYMLWSYTDEPFHKVDIKGQQIAIYNFQGEAFKKELQQIKDWQNNDLTVYGQVMDLEGKAWLGGTAAINMQESSLGYFMGLPLFGKDRLYPAVPLPLAGGSGCITYGVNNHIPAKAPYAQEALDFLLWVDDPKNEEFTHVILNYHWYPVFVSVAENILPKDERYQFMTKWTDLIHKSVWYPNDHPYYNVNTDLINQHCTKLWTNEYKSVDECVKALDADVRKATEDQMAAF